MTTNWAKVDALMGGTKALREIGPAFLPKWNNESPNDYDYRIRTSALFNVFAHTVDSLGGKPFIRPISWTADMPADIISWFDNIDLTGRNLDVFCRELFTAGLAYGMTHVLVDYPRVEGVKTLAQEKAIGARPYLVHLRPNKILGWRSTRKGGIEVLTMLRILEHIEVEDGPFMTKTVEQVRVLEPGKWTTYRFDQAERDWDEFESGTTSLDFIPLLTFYTRRKEFMVADSPLIDVADLNILHWQVSSDMYATLHTASVPILTIIGVEANDQTNAPVEVGAKSALLLPSGATAHFTEHTGKAIAAGAASLDRIETQMRLLGAELLVKQPGQATATQATLDTSQQRAELQAITAVFEDFMDNVIDTMAQWAKIKEPPGKMQIYRDFLLAAEDAIQEALLFSITTTGLLSPQSFYEEMLRRNVYDTDRSWDDEQERIASQPLPAPPPIKPQQAGKIALPSSSTMAALNQ
jgi:hypothetical protein